VHRVTAALLLLSATLLPAAQADWGSFHADSRGSGSVANSSYPVYQDVWWSNKTLNNAQVKASPVIKDGILITTDLGSSLATPPNSGLVRALDVASGHEMWSHKMAAPIEGTPAISGERVYVVDTAGNLKALNLRDGRVETVAISPVGQTLSSIMVHEGALFIGTEAGEMKAYLESTLTLLWTFSISSAYALQSAVTDPKTGITTCTGTPLAAQPVRGAPAVYDHQVFFGSLNHYVFAVDEKGRGDGKTTLTWMYQTGDVVLGAPTINIASATAYRVIIGSYDGNVYAFNGMAAAASSCNASGFTYGTVNTPAWTYAVPNVVDSGTGQTQVSKVQSSPANTGDRVYVGANNGHVYALDAATGAKVWEQTCGDSRAPVTGSPAVANGIVVVGSEDKKVYWLSAANGSILKTFATQGAVGPSPAIDGDRAIVTATEGTTYMFGPKVPPRADLIVSSVAATAVTVTATVKNQGTDPAAATKVRLFVGGTFLADVNVQALAAGESTSITYTGALPAGTQTIKASIDPENVVTESAESNNDFTLTATIAAPGPAPTSAISTTKKKSPAAGLLFAVGLLVCAAAARRRR
jgi:outer membrane protein assembly factor BamB